MFIGYRGKHCDHAGMFRLGAITGFALFAMPAFAAEAPAKEKPPTRQEQLYEFRMQCQKDHGEACLELAQTYETRLDMWGQPVMGDGVRRNDKKAAYYFRRACDLGLKDGCRSLGRMYESGKGVAKSRAEAARYNNMVCGIGDDGHCEHLNGAALRD